MKHEEVTTPLNSHRATGAAIILPDGRVSIGVAVCSPADQFVKATGRQKAIGRAYQTMRKNSFGAFSITFSQYGNPVPIITAAIENAIQAKKYEMGLK